MLRLAVRSLGPSGIVRSAPLLPRLGLSWSRKLSFHPCRLRRLGLATLLGVASGFEADSEVVDEASGVAL